MFQSGSFIFEKTCIFVVFYKQKIEIYFVKIETENGIFTEKIVVEGTPKNSKIKAFKILKV